jgi:MscS family membrane protein
MDDLFLSALSRFSQVMDTWVKTYILKEDYFKMDEKDKSVFIRMLNRVRDSRIGIIVKNRWILSILILLIFYFLSKIVALFFEKVLKRITNKTTISMDEEIVDISMRPAKWIVLFFGLKLALYSLKLSPAINLQLANITTAAIILLVTYIISNVVVIVIRSWGHKVASKLDSRIDDDLVPLFVKVARVIVLSIGIIMVLSRFNVDIAPLIASLGIAGFAIGFAVKDSLANIIGGIVLILDQSFAVGDKVTIDGDTGIIKEVGLRNTKIQTFDNEIIVIPNGDLMNKKFKNSVLPDPKIRVVVEFTVAYGSDVEKVESAVISAIKTLPDITDDPAPAVVFYNMGDFALNFQAKFWVPDYVNQYGKWIEATKLVYQTLQREGISIPFPTQTVYLEKNEGGAD